MRWDRRAIPVTGTMIDTAAEIGERRAPLRVLHIINSLGLGGAEVLLYRLATRESPNEHAVVSLGRPSWHSSRLQERRVAVHHLNVTSPLAVPTGLLRLVRIIRGSDADVVQCWLYHSNVLGGVIAKYAGKPVVWGIHCSSLEPLRLRSRAVVQLGGLLARWVPDFIINCSSRSEELHRNLGYSAAAGAVVHNGYDADEFFPDEASRRSAREGLNLSPNEFAVASVARWNVQKDIPNLLSAVKIAHDRGARLRCFLIGWDLDTENKELRAAIRRAGCDELVVPLGVRPDIQNIARAIDLHVLASCGGEAFPNAVAETMLSGVPNAATDAGDCALMVGASGWIVPPRNPDRLGEAIAGAFHEWRDRPSKWRARRNMARNQIADNFPFDLMVENYEQVWRKVVREDRLRRLPLRNKVARNTLHKIG